MSERNISREKNAGGILRNKSSRVVALKIRDYIKNGYIMVGPKGLKIIWDPKINQSNGQPKNGDGYG